MIRVASPIVEPATFDSECRQRGRQWISDHPKPERRPCDYWSPFREELRTGFARRCGYFAMYMHDGDVDHFMSWANCKATSPHLAYEWSNFRFMAPSLNSKKGTLDNNLLDPFEVQDTWFEVDIPSLVLRITDQLPAHLIGKAQFTIDRLELQQGRKAVTLRWEWYEQHRSGELALAGLERNAPLVARAVERWHQNGNGDLPKIDRPIPEAQRGANARLDASGGATGHPCRAQD
jgi:hypothetical protein